MSGGTLAAIGSTASGIRLQTVVFVEGYPYALTDGPAAAAVTAIAATDWTQALSGLTVQWDLEQSINPWHPFEGNSSRVVLMVQDCDGTDQFGSDVFDRESGNITTLSADVAPSTTDVAVLSTSGFAAAPSYAYVGPEAVKYTALAAAAFQTCTRGWWSPARTESGDRFARYHRATATLEGPDPVSVPAAKVRDSALTWRGRLVYVYLHRVSGSTLDTTAEAHLAFAGRIADVSDAADGRTLVTVESIMKSVTDCVVMREQFRAKVAEGVELVAGRRFTASDRRTTVAGGTTNQTSGLANDLTVVAAGAVAPNQIDAGLYSGDELATKINDWLSSERNAGRLLFRQQLRYADHDPSGDLRSSLHASDPTTTTANTVRGWQLTCDQRSVRYIFGWGPQGIAGTTDGAYEGYGYSVETPRRYNLDFSAGVVSASLPLRAVRGSWVDQSDFLHAPIGSATGYVRIGDSFYGCTTPSITNGEGTATIYIPLNVLLGAEPDQNWASLTPDQDGDVIVSQVLALEAPFKTLVLSLLASTGTADYNWADYDALPDHVGCALPYDLISPLETELAACPGSDDVMTLIVEKPTRLGDLFNADFIVRMVQFIWRQGAVHLKAMVTPTSSATLTIVNADKYRRSDTDDPLRIVSQESDALMANTITIRHNGGPLANEYRDTTTLVDAASAAAHGSRGNTITGRNFVRGIGDASEDLEPLLPNFASVMSLLSHPLMMLKVPIGYPMFETHTPGEAVLVTDPFVRDPATGSRGITGRPAFILAMRYDWADLVGELTLAMFPGLSLAPWSPCARVDETANSGGFSAGYNNGTTTLRCKTNYHSPAGSTADASYFSQSSPAAVLIVEIDPDDPTSPLFWLRTVSGVSGNDITVSSALGGWDNTKLYRIISQDYTSAVTGQRANSYQADNADGLVEDARTAYGLAHFGVGQTQAFDPSVATDYPAKPPDAAFGDGKPLDVGHAFDLATAINSLGSYKLAAQTPEVVEVSTYSGGGTWQLVEIRRVFLSVGRPNAARSRKLHVSPTVLKSGAASADIRVTLARSLPRSADPATTSRDDVVRVQPYSEATFTTTSVTYENQAAVALDTEHLQLGPGGGTGWLYVEVKNHASYRGMGLLHVGPVVAP